MIAYICDRCEESIPKNDERYMIKISEASRKKLPKTICLCATCMEVQAEKIPWLFNLETKE